MGLNPTPHGIQVSQVLPEEVIANLAAWAAQGDQSTWAIARTAQVLAEELSVKREVLDQAIALACNWRASRARDVRSVACFYPVGMEDEFYQLSFSHFRTAMSAGSLDSARKWIDWCLASADDFGGRVAPVDVLAAKMQAAGAKVAAPVWEKWLALVNRTLRKLYLHPSTPPNVSEAVGRVLSVFEHEFPEAAE